MSPKPFTPEHKIQREVEDMEALCRHSKATSIFGLSSGAVIALTCTLRIKSIRRAVIYEPPFYFHNGIDKQRVERFDREVNDRRWVAAMTTAGEIVKLAPLAVRLLPRWLRKRFTAKFMQGLGGGGGYLRRHRPTKTLAKVAYFIAKERPQYRGVCDRRSSRVRAELLSTVPVDEVWGIGSVSAVKLTKIGVQTAADLAALESDDARALMTVTGNRTVYELRGSLCLKPSGNRPCGGSWIVIAESKPGGSWTSSTLPLGVIWVRILGAGPKDAAWKLRAEHRSPSWTTRWDELPKASAK